MAWFRRDLRLGLIMIPARGGDTAAEHARSVADSDVFPVLLPAAPLMHSTGFTSTVSALCAGGCVVLLPSPRFDAAECLSEIERCRVTAIALVGDAFSVPILEELRARGGDYDPWCRPDPRRDFILSLAFAQQRGNAVMLRQASARRLRNRAGGRHAAGARA